MALIATKHPSLAILSHDQEHHGPVLPVLVKIHQHMSSTLRVIFLRRSLKKQATFRERGGRVRKDWRNYMLLDFKKIK